MARIQLLSILSAIEMIKEKLAASVRFKIKCDVKSLLTFYTINLAHKQISGIRIKSSGNFRKLTIYFRNFRIYVNL